MKYKPIYKKLITLAFFAGGISVFLPAGAASVDQAVLATIATDGQSRVIINLKQPGILAAGGAAGIYANDSMANLQAQIKSLQASVLSSVGNELDLTYQYGAVSALAGSVSAKGLEVLRSHPNVASVTEDFMVQVSHNQSRPLIGADIAHTLGYTGRGVEVAILDTGADRDHVDLADDILGGKCFVSHSRKDCVNSFDYNDQRGHGSHVAGTVTGKGSTSPKGIAPDAKIFPIRVFNHRGTNGALCGSQAGCGASTSDINAAFDYLVRFRKFAAVVNLSLGGGKYSGSCNSRSPSTTALINLLRARGTTVWMASGNDGYPQHMGWPACITHGYAVGATYDQTANGKTVNAVTTYSNSNPQLQVLAPGSWISSVAVGGGAANNWNGTSMATPHAAATAAVVRSKNGTLSAAAMLGAVKNTGLWVRDARQGRWTKRVTVNNAVNSVGSCLKPGFTWDKLQQAYHAPGSSVTWGYLEANKCWISSGDARYEEMLILAAQSHHWLGVNVTNLLGNINYVRLYKY